MNKLESQWKNSHSNMGHSIAARGAGLGPSKEPQDAGITQAVLVTKSDTLYAYSQVLLENRTFKLIFFKT